MSLDCIPKFPVEKLSVSRNVNFVFSFIALEKIQILSKTFYIFCFEKLSGFYLPKCDKIWQNFAILTNF